MKRIVLALLLLLLVTALPLAAQQHPNNARGFDPEKVYQTADIDHVNVFNGNLIVTLPIGPKFPVSEALSYGLTLINNGNPWDYRTDGQEGSEAVPSRFANAGLGWQLTLGELIGPNHATAVNLNRQGDWVYAAPDGAERVFKRALHAEEEGTAYEGALPVQTDPGDVVGYTRDSSYLRLVRLTPTRKFRGIIDPDNPSYYFVPAYRIDFPDGTRHTLTGQEYESDTLDDNVNRLYERDNWYRLTKIEDRSGNFVSAAYNGLTWTIADSRGRSHTVTLVRQTFYQFGGAAQQQDLVSHVKLTAPHGKTLEYSFTYGPYKTTSRPCSDGTVRAGGTLTTSTRFLSSVKARDFAAPATSLMTWSFDHEELVTDTNNANDCSYSAGHLKKITLPTGGQISYTAGLRLFPSDKFGTPRDQDGPDPHNISTAVRTRKVTNIDGTSAEWTYEQVQQNAASYYDVDGIQRSGNRELVVRVTDPLARTTAHYFNSNSLQIGGDSCYGGGTALDYGLPYSRTIGTNATSELLLSQVVYPERCVTWDNSNTCPVADPCRAENGDAVQPIRRVYVAYEHDTISPAGAGGTGYNSRLRASRTTFLDDTGCGGVPCYTESRSSNFDGLGHYRVETRSSNFPSTPTRTTTTAYNANPAAGDYVPSGGSSPGNYMIAPGSEWLLNVYKEVASSDSTGSAKTSLCFSAEGLLQRRRTQATADGTRSDLLAAFTYTGGNVTAEEYAGGDEQQLPTDFATCTTTMPAAQYRIGHGYSNGVRNSSQHDGATFKALDLTVDPSGLPTSSRDTAGATTNYEYDVLGRMTKVQPVNGAQPANEAWTEYAYTTYSAPGTPASVAVRQWPYGVASSTSGTPLTERRIYVDGSGRVLQVKTKMPAGWSTVRSRYDILGQKVAVSMPEYRMTADYEPAFTPAHETTFTYDTFGRPKSSTTPDSKTSTVTYTGTRQIARTVSIGGPANWNVQLATPAVSERNVTTTETYDGHGRLVSVAENTGTPTTTSYTYDYADRLIKVTQGAQVRNFTYDSRGLLLAEQHPEKGFAGSGWVDYARYDARGHAKERSEGSIKLTFAFDAAERLTNVYDTDGSGNARSLKEFTFGVAGNENGKLKTAKRHNRSDLGDVIVTEQYTYDGRGGRVSSRVTTADSTMSFNGATFTLSQTWDELGNLDTLTYPTTPLASRPLSVTNSYTNGLLTSVGSYATVTYRAN
ncbi:MAG TPA: RHS repeat domain-containing protein, partial [Thermoanaerobaculia bacterium]